MSDGVSVSVHRSPCPLQSPNALVQTHRAQIDCCRPTQSTAVITSMTVEQMNNQAQAWVVAELLFQTLFLSYQQRASWHLFTLTYSPSPIHPHLFALTYSPSPIHPPHMTCREEMTQTLKSQHCVLPRKGLTLMTTSL